MNFQQLLALAEAATPGPWETEGATLVWSPSAKAVVAAASALWPENGWVRYEKPSLGNLDGPAANAKYIAAADPTTIAALIRRLIAAEAVVDVARRVSLLNDDCINEESIGFIRESIGFNKDPGGLMDTLDKALAAYAATQEATP